MQLELREHQYELLPADASGTGLLFGTEDTGYMTITRPVHSGGEATTNDTQRPSEDGIMFSRDYYGGKSIAFEIGVLTDINNRSLGALTPAEAHRMNLEYLDALEGWWKAPEWREKATSMAMLRAKEAASGETYRAYGRPRRYDEVVGSLTRLGYSTVACDFQMIDDRWYSDVEYGANVSLIIPPDGGLIAPIIAPITTLAEVQNVVKIDVGGSRRTWIIVEFHGPVDRPSVQIGLDVYTLDATVAAGQKVTIDPRPWRRTVTRSGDGASLAGRLTRGTPPLSKMLVDPGDHIITFRGSDPSGTAKVNLRWRNARGRP